MATRYQTIAQYLKCRTLGHAWEPIPAEHAGPHGGDVMWIRCERCATVRQDEVDTMGGVMSRRYVYDDSYRHAFDNNFADAAPTRSDFRLIFLSEAIEQQRSKRVQHPSKTTQQKRKAN